MGILMFLGLCLLTAGLVGSGAFEKAPLGAALGVALILALALLMRWLSKQISQRGLTPEQCKRRNLVKRCVRISTFKKPGLLDKQGSIVFEFGNPSFAAEFSTMNLGEIV